jgi:hypothetical protein
MPLRVPENIKNKGVELTKNGVNKLLELVKGTGKGAVSVGKGAVSTAATGIGGFLGGKAASDDDEESQTAGMGGTGGLLGAAARSDVGSGASGGALPSIRQASASGASEKMGTEKLLVMAINYLASIDSSLKNMIEFDRFSLQQDSRQDRETSFEGDKKRSLLGRIGDSPITKKLTDAALTTALLALALSYQTVGKVVADAAGELGEAVKKAWDSSRLPDDFEIRVENLEAERAKLKEQMGYDPSTSETNIDEIKIPGIRETTLEKTTPILDKVPEGSVATALTAATLGFAAVLVSKAKSFLPELSNIIFSDLGEPPKPGATPIKPTPFVPAGAAATGGGVKTLGKMFGKLAGPLALVLEGNDYVMGNKEVNARNIFGSVGAVGLSSLAATAGFATAPLTGIGAIPVGLGLGAAGYHYGQEAGTEIYDYLFNPKDKPEQSPTERYETGSDPGKIDLTSKITSMNINDPNLKELIIPDLKELTISTGSEFNPKELTLLKTPSMFESNFAMAANPPSAPPIIVNQGSQIASSGNQNQGVPPPSYVSIEKEYLLYWNIA